MQRTVLTREQRSELDAVMRKRHGNAALARLLGHLDEARTGGACLLPLFKREIGPSEYGRALSEALAHLNHLHRAGQVRRWLNDDGAWLWQRTG